MLLRLIVVFALASALLMANQRKLVPHCCTSDDERLSPQQVRVLLQKTEPIHAPCCADMLHISGTIVLAISVDANGEVTCVEMVSGHPLIIGGAIDSVRQWKFRPYALQGLKKSFCGRVVLRYQANEYAVKYKVI